MPTYAVHSITHPHTHAHSHILTHRQRFGNLVEVRGDKYDHYIENSPPQTFVIMHIYDEVHTHTRLLNVPAVKLSIVVTL